MKEFNIKFILPGSFFIFKKNIRTIKVPKGTDLLSAAVKCGVAINSFCGGDGLCGKCKVSINDFAKTAKKGSSFADFYDSLPNILTSQGFRALQPGMV